MDRLRSIFELREMLHEMERDVGLDRLTRAERDVFLAAKSLSRDEGDVVDSQDIRSHRLVRSLTQPTYYRTLRALLKHGLLERAAGTRAKCYVVRADNLPG